MEHEFPPFEAHRLALGARRTNPSWIAIGRVEVRYGSVSQLPFDDGMFDLVTAVETHFWWPNLPSDVREVFRVTKAGSTPILIAEIYKGANTRMAKLAKVYASRTGMTLLEVNGHRARLANAGFSEVECLKSAARNDQWGELRRP